MQRALAAALAAAVTVVLGAGCNSNDSGGTKPPTGTIDVKPGKWFVQVTASSGNPTCKSLADYVSSSDSVTICGKADPGDFLQGLNCDFAVNGNEVPVTCAGSQTFLGCNIAYQGNATGMFNTERTLFTLNMPVQLNATNPSACGGTLDCVMSITIVARWVNDGGCTSAEFPSLEAVAAALLAPLERLDDEGAGQ